MVSNILIRRCLVSLAAARECVCSPLLRREREGIERKASSLTQEEVIHKQTRYDTIAGRNRGKLRYPAKPFKDAHACTWRPTQACCSNPSILVQPNMQSIMPRQDDEVLAVNEQGILILLEIVRVCLAKSNCNKPARTWAKWPLQDILAVMTLLLPWLLSFSVSTIWEEKAGHGNKQLAWLPIIPAGTGGHK